MILLVSKDSARYSGNYQTIFVGYNPIDDDSLLLASRDTVFKSIYTSNYVGKTTKQPTKDDLDLTPFVDRIKNGDFDYLFDSKTGLLYPMSNVYFNTYDFRMFERPNMNSANIQTEISIEYGGIIVVTDRYFRFINWRLK